MKKLLLTLIVLSFGVQINAQTIDSCVVIQPGFGEGFDTEVFSCAPCGYDTTNYGNIQDICATAWTNGGNPGVVRSLMYFNLAIVPSNYIISSAKLSLFHNPISPEGSHNSLTGSNTSMIQRIITAWDDQTVTWNTQPQTTIQNQVLLPASTSATQNYIDMDVTQLVVDMIANPNSSYGFMFKLQVESYYRKLVFASSDHTNSALHPKLEICMYPDPTSIGEVNSNNLNVNIFPNPVQDILNIKISNFKQGAQLKLFDIAGRLLMEKSISSEQTQINVSGFAKGVYIVEIQSEESSIARQKVVIGR